MNSITKSKVSCEERKVKFIWFLKLCTILKKKDFIAQKESDWLNKFDKNSKKDVTVHNAK